MSKKTVYNTITNVELADFYDDQATVSVTVTAESKDFSIDKDETFHVQTVDGEYRSDLGCWITTDNSDGDISYEDYPYFDFDEIIEKAENFLSDNSKYISTMYLINNRYACIVERFKKVEIVTVNPNFINSDTSSYQCEYSAAIEEFETVEDAYKYLEENYSEQD